LCKKKKLYSLSYRDTDLWREASLLRITGHSYWKIVTPWNKVLLMNVTAVQEFLLYVQQAGSVPCLEYSSTGPYFETLESSPHI
jgi:hypothetical protein